MLPVHHLLNGNDDQGERTGQLAPLYAQYRPPITAFAALGPAHWPASADITSTQPDLILLIDRYGVCREYLTENALGATSLRDAHIGRTLAELFDQSLANQLHRCNRQLFATQQPQNCQLSILVDEQQHLLDARFTYCGPNRALLVLRDVTAQVARERLQHEREALLYTLIDDLPGVMFFQIALQPDCACHFTYLSAGVAASTGGYAAQAVLENPDLVIKQLFPADQRLLLDALCNLAATHLPVALEVRKHLPNGELRWSLFRAIYHTSLSNGSMVINGFEVDITEQKRSAEALHLRNRILESIPHGVMLTSCTEPDDPIVYVNPRFEQLTGYTAAEILGRNSRFLHGPETDPQMTMRLRTAIRQRESFMLELLNYRKDGTSFWNALSIAPLCDDNGLVTHYVGVQTDVTAFKALEAQFQQSQKMEAVGRLASGVAHDFNNILTIVNSYCEMILRRHNLDASVRRQIGQICEASERGAALTNQLLAFSRKQFITPVVLDLNQVITKMQKMITRLIGEDIIMHLQLAPQRPQLKIDLGQLEQVLMNLAVNARDAMPDGGILTIRVHTVVLSADRLPPLRANLPSAVLPALYPTLPYPAGNFVQISVYDTGEGMDEQTRRQIFEPFFTTKPVGKGTGLGLSTVYGIISQNGGFIEVESEVGRGTAFHLWLPQTEEQAVIVPHKDALATRLEEGTEAILVVEDDDQIRSLTTLILQEKGYTIFAAANSLEAAKMAEAALYPFDLLVTDLIMPGGNGLDLYALLAARQPALKVLFVSGYTHLELSQHELVLANNFLPKPFTLELLLHKVRDVLDRAP